MSDTVANDDQKPETDKTPGKRLADETAVAHRQLRAQLEQVERALQGGDLQKSAHLLSDLITQARTHFLNEENIARSAGLSLADGERLAHDALVERARRLKARCFNSPANTDMRHNISSDLVLLLSDLAERDIRFSTRAANTSLPKSD